MDESSNSVNETVKSKINKEELKDTDIQIVYIKSEIEEQTTLCELKTENNNTENSNICNTDTSINSNIIKKEELGNDGYFTIVNIDKIKSGRF